MIAHFGRLSFSLAAVIASLTFATQQATAQTSVEFVEQGGVRYRVTRQAVQRPVSSLEWTEQQQTVYRERYDTQWQTNYRTFLTPVTEYRQELYLVNRWNPLATPYWTYRYVPVTRWEARQEPYNVPIAQRSWVPEQQTVRVPRTSTQMATAVYESREPVGAAIAGGAGATSPPTSVAVGGMKKFD